MDIATEVSDALNRTVGEQYDDEELMNELNGMMEEDMETQMLQVPTISATSTTSVATGASSVLDAASMPSAPTGSACNIQIILIYSDKLTSNAFSLDFVALYQVK